MLQNQFYMRIMLLIAVGIVYVKAYMNMAVRNSKETEPERHRVLKVLGGFWAIMAIIMGGMGVYMITQITFPQEAIGPYISPNMIIRTSDQTMYWGYATFPQSQCLSVIGGVFEFLALSSYCFLFKSSHSKWYSKAGKILFCVLFYIFYASATDFHYFDLYEWTAPGLFAIMAFFALRNKKEESKVVIIDDNNISNSDSTPLQVVETERSQSNTEDDSRYMPHIEENNILNRTEDETLDNKLLPPTDVQPVDPLNVAENKDDHIYFKNDIKNVVEDDECPKIKENVEPVVRFCRHCGEKIDYNSVRFCKHCGKKLI